MHNSQKPLWAPSWQQTDVEIKNENLVYRGFYQVKQFLLKYRCFGGEWSPWLTREQIRHADAAAVILFDPIQDRLVLVEQIRIGMIGVYQDTSPWLLEIVAGLLEPGENAENAAIREAQEETERKITKLIKIGEFYNSPGGFAEKTSVFCGFCESEGVEGPYNAGNAEHEDICIHVLPRKCVLDAFASGSLITSSSTVIALQWLANYYKK